MKDREQFLHYIWKLRLFAQTNLLTTDNQTIEIIDPGIYNMNAGPDFFNAKIKIGNKVWAGNVEIHCKADDWAKHKHNEDESYDSVILHVAEKINCEVFNTKGMQIPQLKLIVTPDIEKKADNLLQSSLNIPCKNHLPNIDKKVISSWLNVLAIERIERKTDDIFTHLSRYNNSWDDVLYVLLSRNYGFGINSDAFERLALSLPYNLIQKHGDNLFQIEALMFGQAGMLQNKSIADDYYLRLKNEYHFLQNKYQLKPLQDFLFKKMRVRPKSFPQIRIAQLASLLQQSGRLFSTLLDIDDYKRLRLYFQSNTSEYWKHHFTFEKKSEKSDKYLGDSSLNIILINTVVPILFAYGKKTEQEKYIDRAIYFLESIKPERNAIINEFKEYGITPANAADSQSLIQLRKEYCDKRKCLYCKIGYSILAQENYNLRI